MMVLAKQELKKFQTFLKTSVFWTLEATLIEAAAWYNNVLFRSVSYSMV